MIRTDLAAEFISKAQVNGVMIAHRRIPYPVTEVKICTEEAAKSLGKPLGRYFTVEGLSFDRPPEELKETVEALLPLFRSLLRKPFGEVLVVGLGNREITPDALGPKTVNGILVTRHLKERKLTGFSDMTSVTAIAPGVLGQTGMESAQLVKALCKEIKPDLLIVIDALAAASKERLCSSLQFSDTGIAPGSGVANHRDALDEKALGIPVIAVGVPTVIALEQGSNLFVTPRDADLCMEHAGKLIAQLCNAALHPKVPFDTLLALTG